MSMDIPTLKAAIAEKAARPPRASVGQHDLAIVRGAVADEIAKLCTWAAAEHIREGDRLRAIYGLDGIDRIELALSLEDRFGLGELDASGWRKVGDVVSAVSHALIPSPQR